jgi:hypothetical protein
MRTTVDIPDPVYRQLKSQAALRGCSVKELILRGVETELARPDSKRKPHRVKLPIVDSSEPGSLHLTNKVINELLFPY